MDVVLDRQGERVVDDRADVRDVQPPRGDVRCDEQRRRPVLEALQRVEARVLRGQRGPRTLVVTAGPLTGTKITLGDQPILIGRADDSTLVLTDDFASSRHARLTNRGGQWYVEDLGSTNGTYLDQQRVQGPLLVNPGQPIRIGQTALELR